MRGAVLAGGLARRFGGRPKGLELVGTARMLDRVTDQVALATGQPPTLIADPEVAAAWRPDLRVVPDAIPGCGALGGIYTALCDGEGPVLVAGWDMPFLTVEVLRAIVLGLGDYDAFLPESRGPQGMEPLCAAYDQACRAPIHRRILERDLRATGFHEAVRVGTLSIDAVRRYGDPDVTFFNVNSDADLEAARRLWQSAHGATR